MNTSDKNFENPEEVLKVLQAGGSDGDFLAGGAMDGVGLMAGEDAHLPLGHPTAVCANRTLREVVDRVEVLNRVHAVLGMAVCDLLPCLRGVDAQGAASISGYLGGPFQSLLRTGVDRVGADAVVDPLRTRRALGTKAFHGAEGLFGTPWV